VRCGEVVPVPPGKQRSLLAALLLSAGQAVSIDDLTEILWGSSPPPSARITVQNYVMRLRKILGPAGSRISTQPRGYLIAVKADELDVSRFEAHLDASRKSALDGDWEAAGSEARAGLSLWRGQPLDDVESDLLRIRDVPRLAELRLQMLEIRIDADLHLARHATVVTELQQLTAAHPLRERLHGQLLLALYRDGRQGEALAAYQHARRILINELGAEPGAWLQTLHQRILAADRALSLPEPAMPAAGNAVATVPRELPAPVTHFVGRADELATLTKLLDQIGGQMPGAVVISAIGGTAGVGKTALALQWAHQVAEHFPDGQLYVNLRGFDTIQPVIAVDALAGFLRSLGVPGQDIPASENECAARYRSLLSGKRMLVMLDNAASAEQVRLLIPGTPSCTVVVTSRDALPGLVARDGAQRLDLDVLPREDAVALLRALIGTRVDAAPDAAAALAEQCSLLPLALRVAAELAAARPAVPLARFVSELSDQERRLDLLNAGGDPRVAVRAVFSWSYQHLDADAARAFRLVALHPGPDQDPYAAAALIGTTLDRAVGLLGQLTRAYLVQPVGPGRCGMHDLLRAYARELAATQDTEEERRAALTRLFDHYLHTASVMVDAVFPADRDRRPCIPLPATPVPPMADLVTARAWLDAERANLTVVAAFTAGNGWPSHAIRLAAILFRYLDTGGHYAEAVTIHTHARCAARAVGDSAAEATALTSLGLAQIWQGRYGQAADILRQALALFSENGDRAGQARVLLNLGVLDLQRGRYQQATSHLEQSLAFYGEVGDAVGEARALGNLGFADLRQGRYRLAATRLERAAALSHEIPDRTGEAHALGNLGLVDMRQGRYPEADAHLRRSLVLFHETGDPNGEAHALTDLGDVYLRQCRYQQATDYYRRALALCHQIGDRSGEAEALNGLGEMFLATRRPGEARTQHAAALDLAGQVGHPYEQARAHSGLGDSYHLAGHLAQARSHWQEALTLYADLGVPEANQVRAQLGAADDDVSPEP
jgi:DNA-binding SARP family transcriptional activator/Tfp pilus assembly protein PilF